MKRCRAKTPPSAAVCSDDSSMTFAYNMLARFRLIAPVPVAGLAIEGPAVRLRAVLATSELLGRFLSFHSKT